MNKQHESTEQLKKNIEKDFIELFKDKDLLKESERIKEIKEEIEQAALKYAQENI